MVEERHEITYYDRPIELTEYATSEHGYDESVEVIIETREEVQPELEEVYHQISLATGKTVNELTEEYKLVTYGYEDGQTIFKSKGQLSSPKIIRYGLGGLYEQMESLTSGEIGYTETFLKLKNDKLKPSKEDDFIIQIILLSAITVDKPYDLEEFQSEPISLHDLGGKKEPTISLNDLANFTVDESDGVGLTDDNTDVYLDDESDEIALDSDEQETMYTFSEVEELVKQAFQDGYQQAIEELE